MCLYAYTHSHIYIYTFTKMSTFTKMWLQFCVYGHMSCSLLVCANLFVTVCVPVCVLIYACARVHIYSCVSEHACVILCRICVYICV